jgi:hypothetical protein
MGKKNSCPGQKARQWTAGDHERYWHVKTNWGALLCQEADIIRQGKRQAVVLTRGRRGPGESLQSMQTTMGRQKGKGDSVLDRSRRSEFFRRELEVA